MLRQTDRQTGRQISASWQAERQTDKVSDVGVGNTKNKYALETTVKKC